MSWHTAAGRFTAGVACLLLLGGCTAGTSPPPAETPSPSASASGQITLPPAGFSITLADGWQEKTDPDLPWIGGVLAAEDSLGSRFTILVIRLSTLDPDVAAADDPLGALGDEYAQALCGSIAHEAVDLPAGRAIRFHCTTEEGQLLTAWLVGGGYIASECVVENAFHLMMASYYTNDAVAALEEMANSFELLPRDAVLEAVTCEPPPESTSPPLPPGTETQKVTVADSGIVVDPTTVRAGEVALLLSWPTYDTGQRLELVGPLESGEIARLAEGDTGWMDAYLYGGAKNGAPWIQEMWGGGFMETEGYLATVTLAPGPHAWVRWTWEYEEVSPEEGTATLRFAGYTVFLVTKPPASAPIQSGSWAATIPGAKLSGRASLSVPAAGWATAAFSLHHLKKGVSVSARILAGASCHSRAQTITRLPGYTTTVGGTWHQRWVFDGRGLVRLRSAMRSATPLWFDMTVGGNRFCTRFVPTA